MTMAGPEYPNHVNRNPNSPDRKLPVQPMFESPDRTIGTTGSDSLVPESPAGHLSQEVDDMISVVRNFVEGSPRYSPTRKEFESTMEAIEAKDEEEKSIRRQQKLEQAAQMRSQEASFMDSIYGAFTMSSSSCPPAVSLQPSAGASTRGTVVHEMLKRLVLQELLSRRNKGATVIQSTIRRVLAQKKIQEMRVIAAERKRALYELAMFKKYEQFSTKAAAAADGEGNCAKDDEEEDEVVDKIRTSKLSKIKTAFKSFKRTKKKKNMTSKALLLPSTPEEESWTPPFPQEEEQQGGAELPVQENSDSKSKWWKAVKKMKVKKSVSKKREAKKGAFGEAKKGAFDEAKKGAFDEAKKGAFDEAKKGAFDGVVEEEPLRTVIITTTDITVPMPEDEAEADAYRQKKLKEAAERGVEEESPPTPSHASLPSSLPSHKYLEWKSNVVLADDATSITSARSRPMLDAWFGKCIFDQDTLKEVGDDALAEMAEIAISNKELHNDLKIIPEMNWTEEDWVDFKSSMFRCSNDHVEEVTYQTKRFISNEVTL